MITKYFVQSLVNPWDEHEIEPDLYVDLKGRSDLNVSIWKCESNYASIIENLIDLESYISLTVSKNRYTSSIGNLNNEIASLSRLISNLLFSCRQYFDQVSRRLKSIDPDLCSEFCANRKKTYDTQIEFRFLEKLRDHNQHKESGIHGIKISNLTSAENDKNILLYSISATINLNKLREDRNFPRHILNDMIEKEYFDNKGNCHNFHSILILYISSISKIHEPLRNSLLNIKNNNIKTMIFTTKSVTEHDEKKPVYFKKIVDGQEVENFGIPNKENDATLELASKYCCPIRAEGFRIVF